MEKIAKEDQRFLNGLDGNFKNLIEKEIYKGFSILSYQVYNSDIHGNVTKMFCAVVDDGESIMDITERPRRIEVIRVCREYIDANFDEDVQE